MNLKIIQQYNIVKMNILYPLNKVVVKNIFCINNYRYLFHINENRTDSFYIIEDSTIIKIKLDFIKSGVYFMKKNKYYIKLIKIVEDKKKNIYLNLNNTKIYLKNCIDIYLEKLFYDIYNYAF